MSSMTLSPAGAQAARARPRPGRPGELRLTRRGRLVVLAAFLLGALAVVLFSLSGSATGSAERGAPVPVQVVQVEAGDTLWSIATRVAPGEDPRDVVDEIQDLNNIDGALRVGTELAVPVDR
jgi:hypothetical protein